MLLRGFLLRVEEDQKQKIKTKQKAQNRGNKKESYKHKS